MGFSFKFNTRIFGAAFILGMFFGVSVFAQQSSRKQEWVIAVKREHHTTVSQTWLQDVLKMEGVELRGSTEDLTHLDAFSIRCTKAVAQKVKADFPFLDMEGSVTYGPAVDRRFERQTGEDDECEGSAT